MRGRLYCLLNIVLLTGFVYWLILVSILVCVSLFLQVQSTGSEHEHWCVWVGTFALLVVFAAVLALGSLAACYLRQESIRQPLIEYWHHTTPLSTCHLDFQKLVNLNTLVPLLCKNRVLGCEDLRKLHRLYQESRTVQVGELVAILDTKGKEGICKLIESLNEDEEHIGHWELSKILDEKYRLEITGFPHNQNGNHNLSNQWP